MAVKIRLKRMGSKKNPFYRIVVADSRGYLYLANTLNFKIPVLALPADFFLPT